jgi:hypothetical protein
VGFVAVGVSGIGDADVGLRVGIGVDIGVGTGVWVGEGVMVGVTPFQTKGHVRLSLRVDLLPFSSSLTTATRQRY